MATVINFKSTVTALTIQEFEQDLFQLVKKYNTSDLRIGISSIEPGLVVTTAGMQTTISLHEFVVDVVETENLDLCVSSKEALGQLLLFRFITVFHDFLGPQDSTFVRY